MFSSLRSRLWLSYSLLISTALSVVAIFVVIYLIRNPLLYRQSLEKLRIASSMIAQGDNVSTPSSLFVQADEVARTFDVRVLHFSRDGQMIFDTHEGSAVPIPFPERRTVSRAIPFVRDAQGRIWLISRAILADGSFMVAAMPRPRASILNVFADDLLPSFLLGGAIAFGLSLVLAFLLARWVADPLQKIISAARNMPSNKAQPIEVGGPQEVRELTRAFNSMVGRVQDTQQSQRDFVANVSHELKTPLTSIQGFSQAILDGTAKSTDELRQAAQVIQNESVRMYRLVVDLLDLARLDGGIAEIEMAPVNVSELFQAIIEKFRPQSIKAGVDISRDVPRDLPMLIADGDRLMQVFSNLVDNSLKFTPKGGHIKLHASVHGSQMVFLIEDSGSGISPEIQSHIFERFYRADPARTGGADQGAGLGLAIAREIIQSHGGRIAVHSKEGAGTVFEIQVPRTSQFDTETDTEIM